MCLARLRLPLILAGLLALVFGPFRAKKRPKMPPCGAKTWGSGGAPPTTLILLRNQRRTRTQPRRDATSREREVGRSVRLEVPVGRSLSCIAAFAAGKNGAPGAGTPYLRRAKYARLQRMAVSSDDTNAILASQDKREESMESSLRFSIHARSDNSHALTGLGYAMGLAA